MVKVSYSLEEKRRAVQTYRRFKSVMKTVRKLGYPSPHVLSTWVKESVHKRPPRHYTPFQQYSWRLKLQAVQRVEGGD